MVKNNPYIWIYVTLCSENFESLKKCISLLFFILSREATANKSVSRGKMTKMVSMFQNLGSWRPLLRCERWINSPRCHLVEKVTPVWSHIAMSKRSMCLIIAKLCNQWPEKPLCPYSSAHIDWWYSVDIVYCMSKPHIFATLLGW